MGKATLFFAAGHGGIDAGNTTTGVKERDELIKHVGGQRLWCRKMSIPQEYGGIMFLDDELDLLGELAVIENHKLSALDGDLAIDWHLDYRPNQSGALVLYDETPYAATFAQLFLARWCRGTGIKNNGVFRSVDVAKIWRNWDDFGFCRPRWPGVIVELGCINSAYDLAAVRDLQNQALSAQLAWECWREARR